MEDAPAYCFTIPSVSDGTLLDCRIYHPVSFQDAHSAPFYPSKLAVVAHPYAPLGGCMDDAVVMAIVEQLIDLGFIVGTFNFRGAANSQGSTSWAGKAERDDYTSVAGHLLFYLHQLLQLEHTTDEPAKNDLYTNETQNTPLPPITLILGGYSYGSLIVTNLPSTSDILATFRQTQKSASVPEILLRAKELAHETDVQRLNRPEARGRVLSQPQRGLHKRQSSSQHSIVFGGSDSPSPADGHTTHSTHKHVDVPARIKNAMHRNHKNSNPATLTPPLASLEEGDDHTSETMPGNLPHVLSHYLLISPLLPPLSNLLALSTSSLQFWRHAATKTDNLVQNPTLVIYGANDMFTSAHRLDTWCRKMDEMSTKSSGSSGNSSFRWKKIEGAGHFWRERGVEAQLIDSLRGWVHDICE